MVFGLQRGFDYAPKISPQDLLTGCLHVDQDVILSRMAFCFGHISFVSILKLQF